MFQFIFHNLPKDISVEIEYLQGLILFVKIKQQLIIVITITESKN